MSSSSSTTNTTHNTNTNTTNNSIMKALYAQRQHEHQQQLELSHKQQQEEEEESARYYQQYLKSLASETTNNNPSTGITTPPSMKRTSSSSSTKNARVDFAGSITTSFSDEDDEKERSSSSLWKNLSTSLPSAPSAASATNTTTTTTNRSSLASKNTRSYVMDVQQNTHQQQEQPLRYSSGDSLGEMKISVTDMRNSLLQGRPLSTVREGMTKEVSTHNPPPPMKQKVPATTSSSSSSPKTTRSRRPAPPTLPPPPEPTLTFWKKQRERILKKWRKPPKYRLFKLCQLLSGAYIVFMSFTFVGTLGDIGGLVDPDSGWIVDRTSTENTNKGVILINGDLRAVVAQTDFQMIALAISRLSAFTMYPALIVVFFSKFRGTMNFVSYTYIGQMLLAADLHDLHSYCGYYILIDGWIHTMFHMLRWGAQNNLYLLYTNPTGISGLIVIGSTVLICLPMMFWKRKIRYEIRKYVHYLFLIFGLAMCFHVPASGFPNGGFAPYVFGILLSWWALDNLYVQWFLTEKIQSSRFYVLPSGVQLTMAVSKRFQSWGPGGYCYVCLPWVNPHQWHAFSLFENPIEPSERQIFMQKLGDWTTQVHTMLGRETSRPVWIQGPFASPYGNADNYDSQILVAGGIGITPALSVIRQLKDTRRCNLIWVTRERHMLEFFIKHADLSHRGWNLVFYTGKEQLLGIEDVVVTGNGATIHIIRQRPKLNFVIPNIIYGIESGTSRPEQFVPDDKIVAMELLQEKLAELEEDPMMNSHEKLSELVNYCDELGYLFSDLISTLPNHEELTKTPLVSMENKSNRSVLDAILHYNSSGTPKNGDSNNTANDRRGMFLNQAQGRGDSKRTMLNSSRGMLASASRRRLTESGSSGMRHRRSNEPRLSGDGGGKRGPSITTSTWGALAASIQVVKAMKQFEFSEEDESSQLDIESARMPTMQEQMEFPFKPWEYNQEAEDYVKNMGRQALSTWGVLYCGGKTPLEKALRKAARKAKVQMHEESFAW